MAATQAQKIAQLEAQLAASEAARLTAERKALKGDRFAVIMWFNDDATPDNRQPEYRSTFRFVIPEGFKAGDPLWLDLGLYAYNAETCPYKFDPKGDLPELTGSIGATAADYAAEKEADRKAALKARAAKQR